MDFLNDTASKVELRWSAGHLGIGGGCAMSPADAAWWYLMSSVGRFAPSGEPSWMVQPIEGRGDL